MRDLYNLIQLTSGAEGHCLYHTGCFSPGDQWIVFDSRNDDTQIGATATVKIVNIQSHEVQTIYQTTNQTIYGPGVGAASFSPVRDRVVFIHGIRNACEEDPYSFTRRTGVAIDIDDPFSPVYMDARNITPPFTPGALRGGSHAHTWNGDGQWICFTYNDRIMEKLQETNGMVKDLRTVGVMVPGAVEVLPEEEGENNNGEMFSVVVTSVTENPLPGSDQISKAFDEGWVGAKGYPRSDGEWQHRAIAFQGIVKDIVGAEKTEIFIVDLPADVTRERPGFPLAGTELTRPNIPGGVSQRRLTYGKGISGPRHWLRSSPDGTKIFFLSTDEEEVVQVFSISPHGGQPVQVTFNKETVEGPFNISPCGEYVAYIAGGRVYCTHIQSCSSVPLTTKTNEDGKPPQGAVVWSNDGNMLAFNRYVKEKKSGNFYLQIFLLKAIPPNQE